MQGHLLRPECLIRASLQNWFQENVCRICSKQKLFDGLPMQQTAWDSVPLCRLLRAMVIKGMLESTTTSSVNLVNADLLAKERGLRVIESTVPDNGKVNFLSAMTLPSQSRFQSLMHDLPSKLPVSAISVPKSQYSVVRKCLMLLPSSYPGECFLSLYFCLKRSHWVYWSEVSKAHTTIHWCLTCFCMIFHLLTKHCGGCGDVSSEKLVAILYS